MLNCFFRLPETMVRPSKMEYTSLTPVSKIQINQPSERPLDRPTLVRPQRTSTVLIQNTENNSTAAVDPFLMMQVCNSSNREKISVTFKYPMPWWYNDPDHSLLQ